jgi:peroxiredoxin
MRAIPLVAALALFATPIAAPAALAVGAKAPDFSTQGALGGKQFDLKLSNALKSGPVVLYFFPAAFTPGCTIEANQFAEATAEFNKLGASVIGMSADPIDKLADFSVKECRSKFPVATASPAVITAYDVKMPKMANMPPAMQEKMAGLTSRTSYVIAPDGKIIYAHSDLDYKDHMKNTLAAVQKWHVAHGGH